jgi:hypothetical protein
VIPSRQATSSWVEEEDWGLLLKRAIDQAQAINGGNI